MNKFLRYSFVALLTMMGFGAAMAGTIVFGELGLENSVQYTEPFDGGDFTVTFAGGQNDGKYYTAGAGIRVYGNGTMTVAAKSGTLKKITVTFATGDSYRPADNNVVNTGTFDAATGVWTGDAASVVFTRPSGNGHWRVAAVSTDDSEDPGTDPNPEPGDDTLTGKGTLESPYTVADAIIVTGKLDNGQTSTDDYYIKGKISSIKYTFDVEHGTATFNISDTGAAENEFTCYGVYYLENKSWADGNTQVAVGDEVIIYGKVTNYNGTLETASKKAYIYSLNGVTKNEGGSTDPDPQPGDETLTGKGTLESPYTVADAIIVTGKLDKGQTSTDDYYIKGKISSIKYTFDVEHGTATFNISDTGAAENEFTCYGVYYLDNRAWAEGDTQVAVGDEVIIYGKVTNYNGTLETASKKAYIYSLNGVSTGINEVKTAAQTAGNVYNLAGQKVGAGFKGIVIVNGKKMIQK